MIIPDTTTARFTARELLRECEAAPRTEQRDRFIGALRKALGMPSNNDLRKRQ